MQSTSLTPRLSLERPDVSNRSRAKILVIHDIQQPLSFLIQRRLKSRGYSVCSVRKGTSFSLTAKAFKPDLVLLNVNAPQLYDLECPEGLDTATVDSDAPLYFVSSMKIADHTTLGLSIGERQNCTRPINVQSIIDSVEQVLDQFMGPQQAINLLSA